MGSGCHRSEISRRRRRSAPLAALARSAQALADGDADAPLSRGGASEVVALAADFSAMRDHLVAREQERATLLAQEREARQRLEDTNAALERATQAKSEFLANMSHEI